MINYYINKTNFIEINNKKLKNKIKKNSVLKIKKQENFTIIGKCPLTKKKSNEKENKKILKNGYNNSTTNKRVTIIDIKDQNFILNIYKNENNNDIKNNIQRVKFEKKITFQKIIIIILKKIFIVKIYMIITIMEIYMNIIKKIFKMKIKMKLKIIMKRILK